LSFNAEKRANADSIPMVKTRRRSNQDLQQQLSQLDALMQQAQWQEAAPQALALFEALPTAPGVLEKAVVTLRELQDWAGLSELLLRARNRYGLWPKGSDLQLGQALLEQGELERAHHVLEQALQDADSEGWAHHFLGKALRQSDDLEAALEHQRTAAELLPTFPWAVFEAAQALIGLNRHTEAVVEVQEARRRAGDPADATIEALWQDLQPMVALLRIDALTAQGQQGEAMAALRPLLIERPDDDAVQERLMRLLANPTEGDSNTSDISEREELERLQCELRSVELLLDELEARRR
jgi:tetratricopeptide (TPR) repeat protein